MPPPAPLITAAQLSTRIAALAGEIRAAVPDDDIHFVCVLKGAFLFMADLVRALDDGVSMDFIAVSSYGAGKQSSGEVRLVKDVDTSLEARHVIIIEDIVDTGLTAQFLMQQLAARQARSVKLCSLLHKPARAVQSVAIDYLGFTIDDVFVVGYGLDYAQKYRNLPDICVIES
jgi:hypoxanthine phosphoribosyltransferase